MARRAVSGEIGGADGGVAAGGPEEGGGAAVEGGGVVEATGATVVGAGAGAAGSLDDPHALASATKARTVEVRTGPSMPCSTDARPPACYRSPAAECGRGRAASKRGGYRDDTRSSEERLAALYAERRVIEGQLEVLAPLVERREVVANEIDTQLHREARGMRSGPNVWLSIAVSAGLTVLASLVGLAVVLSLPIGCRTHSCSHARPRTRSDAQAVRSAVLLYLGQEPGAKCPALRELVDTGILDHGRRTTDAWDHPFRIACDGDDIFVRSDGPDGEPGTHDDLE